MISVLQRAVAKWGAKPPAFGVNNSPTHFFKICAATISSTGKDKRSKYSYLYNKPKQHKSKDYSEKLAKRKLNKKEREANSFSLDTTKPMDELLAYSAKGCVYSSCSLIHIVILSRIKHIFIYPSYHSGISREVLGASAVSRKSR
jgi:hypothetical protein